MPGTPGPIIIALIVVICGIIGAMVASLVTKRHEQVPHRRAAEPYVGFLFGAIVGVVGVIAWGMFL